MLEKRNSIKQEPYGDGLIRTWDNDNYKILQNETGALYDVAIDVPNKYTYSETDEKITVLPVQQEPEE